MADVVEVQTPKPAKLTRVPKPDSKALDTAIASIQSEISTLQERVQTIRRVVDEKVNGNKGAREELSAARALVREIRQEKDSVMRERETLFAARDAAKAAREARFAAGKAMRESLKFRDPAEIDSKIAELHRQQATESLTLPQEKALLKEIESLKSQKRAVSEYKEHMDAASSTTDDRKVIQDQLAEKSEQLRGINGRLAAARRDVQRLDSETQSRRQDLPALYKERDALRTQIEAKRVEMGKKRAEFRKLNDVYYAYMRELRQQRQEQQRIQARERAAERERQRAEYEAELATQKPWTEEIALCDVLINYLKAFLPKEEKAVEETTAAALSTVTLADGRVVQALSRKRGGRDADVVIGNKRKGKRGRRNRNKQEAPLRHSLDMLSSFRLLKLDAPRAGPDVAASITALQEKRAYYDTLPRDALKKKSQNQTLTDEQEAVGEEKADPAPEDDTEVEASGVAEAVVTTEVVEAEEETLPVAEIEVDAVPDNVAPEVEGDDAAPAKDEDGALEAAGDAPGMEGEDEAVEATE